MSTWALRLAGDRKRLVLWFTVQGIDRVFKEKDIDCSTILGETRTEDMAAVIVQGSIDIGEETIDLEAGAAKGGSFTARIRQRRGTTALTDLFQQRSRRRTSVGGTTSKTATSISVADSSWAASDTGIIYVGAETIKHTTRPTGTSFGGLTRGMYGSRAQAHTGFGDWQGSAVYDVPPSWLGRRITLYASFLNEDGETTAAKTTTIGTYTIEDDPTQIDERTWELHAGPLADEYAGRKLYVGMRDAAGGAITRPSVSVPPINIEVDQVGCFEVSASGFVTHVLVKTGDLVFTARMYQANASPPSIDVLLDNMFDPAPIFLANGAIRDDVFAESLRHIAVLYGLSTASLLPALCSINGDADNGAYDLLPGAEFSLGAGTGFRMGAGIHEDDVDDAAFTNIDHEPWAYILDRETTVGELLTEWALWSDAYWYVTPGGVLTAARLSETTAASVMAFDESVIVGADPVVVYVEESTIYPLVEVNTNYNPATEEYQAHFLTVDGELLQRYPQREQKRTIDLKGVAVDTPTGRPPRFHHPRQVARESVGARARRWQKSDGRGRLIIKLSTRLKGMKAALGDVVTIGFSAGDREGGDVSGREARIIGRRVRLNDGRVDFTLQVLDPLFLLAPSCVVTAVSTTIVANDTLTLSTTAPDAAGTSPTSDLVVGAIIRLWDVSAGTSQTGTIAAILNATQIRLSAGVTGTVETGVDWLTWSTLGTNTSAGDTANGNNEGDWAYLMDDDAVPAAGSPRRWR